VNDEILVFADWQGLPNPTPVGTLRTSKIRARENFSFSYNEAWLRSERAQQLDPALGLYSGEQFPDNDNNFRVFLDSCPDRWGRLLMKRREAVRAHKENRRPNTLLESDFLLGVHDAYRMGALRFKKTIDGPFLADDKTLATPPLARIRDLEFAAGQVETEGDPSDPEYRNWLNMLVSPGSSLGGARPKACVMDESNSLWIAKFPSKQDDIDVGAWEYIVHRLALGAGIKMSQCRIERFNHEHHTFLTRRFDRKSSQRLHFTSAMTQLGYDDGETDASYLEIAEFLTHHGSNTAEDLEQLWRRIVFNIAVSNTDDHLRNHGFIFVHDGWTLSPAFDINPQPEGRGLKLFITDNDNRLDYDLALEVIEFFRISTNRADEIKDEVLQAVGEWRSEAAKVGMNRAQQESLSPSFRV